MAKQTGPVKIVGTIGNICFYKMEGKYYVRMKSSLTGKQFWKHDAFAGSRRSCKRFAEGNKLASKVYRMIEKEKRAYKLFCFLKKRAVLLLKEGKGVLEVEKVLVDDLREFGFLPRVEKKEEIEYTVCENRLYKMDFVEERFCGGVVFGLPVMDST